MPINVSEAIDAETGEVITVERTTTGQYVDGIWTKGTTSTFKSVCSVQQPDNDEHSQVAQEMSGGERTTDLLKFISIKTLQKTCDRKGTTADVVLYDGQRYKIIAVQKWHKYGYTRAFGVLEE